jgi:hypothetical protein
LSLPFPIHATLCILLPFQSQFSEEDIANIFSGLGVGEESDGEDNIPLMEQFMHLLLSKDVLYAPIKDVLDKVL